MQRDLVDFLIQDLKRKPGLYLTAYSLSYLDIFLTGVLITAWDIDKTGLYVKRIFGEGGFLEWFSKKYSISPSSNRLYPFLVVSDHDEKRALDLFFSELEIYNPECSR